jgi:6-phosphogluconolactonase/glucosamine-6-phosphate isomerase/deaminase
VERPDFSRLSLTLPALSAARTGIFLVTGEEKRWALKQLMEGGPIPASRITAETLLIFADRAAAAYG